MSGTHASEKQAEALELRISRPAVEDGTSLWSLVRESEDLEQKEDVRLHASAPELF